MTASILLVTRNRAEDLRKTLEAMRQVVPAPGMEVELLVVDNGSTDHTAEVVRTATGLAFPVRHILEPREGKSNGLNRGLAESKGEVILFTDDDVRVPADWVTGMCEPILSGQAEVVAGGVRLAASLDRPWMTSTHRSWLAATEWLDSDASDSLVGANMAVSRKVLEKVPGFDPELGGGGLGFCEDGLFASQLKKAGYRFAKRLDVCIEHHPDPSRLSRKSWLAAAEKRGLSHAYCGHHWAHWGCRFGRIRYFRASLMLAAWRLGNAAKIREEGCDELELDLVFKRSMVIGHLAEHHKPRKYARHGLVKNPT
jgi:glucosyl-dolichyl phosphate glucuronosyltransferase